MRRLIILQWISEVLHFCSGLPIILVGCKKDLRYDQKTIEELHKTSQKPVTPAQVRFAIQSLSCSKLLVLYRVRNSVRRSTRPDTRARRNDTRSTVPTGFSPNSVISGVLACGIGSESDVSAGQPGEAIQRLRLRTPPFPREQNHKEEEAARVNNGG